MEMRNNNIPIRKGHIFYHDFKRTYEGSSLVEGVHPAIIISNNTNNRHSEVVVIAPLTSKKVTNKKLPTWVLLGKQLMIGLPKDSIIQCEQPRSIPKSALGDYIGHIDTETMIMLNDALNVQMASGDSTHRKALKETANTMAEGIRFYEKMIVEYKDNLDLMIIDQTRMKIRYEVNKLESFCEENRLFFSDFYKRNASNITSNRSMDNLRTGVSM